MCEAIFMGSGIAGVCLLIKRVSGEYVMAKSVNMVREMAMKS